MCFIVPSDEARLNRQLIQFAEVAEFAIEISRRLIKSGLRLLESQYGGVLRHADDELDPTFERFEIELLKERYGSLTVFRDGMPTRFGYRSSFLDDLLGEAGIARGDLENLSRSENIDSRIDAQPWAWRYRREALCAWRSEAHREIVTEEKLREVHERGINRIKESSSVRGDIEGFVTTKLSEIGYEKRRNRYDDFKVIYTNEKQIKCGVPLEIAFHIDVMPIAGLPASLNLYLMPIFDISGSDDFLIRWRQRGNFFELAGPLIPNFGLYRVAWDEGQLELMLRAYGALLNEIVPVIEDVSAQIS
jgi:hypothetical protein